MSKINRHPVRRTAAGVLAGALALSGAVAVGTPAFAAPSFGLERIAGADRYETSAQTVAAFGTAPGAILAAGENGRQADALAASFLAGVRGVPVALTTKTRVTAEVLAALNGLGGKNITIIGGEDAVSDSVVTQLQGAGFTVDRIGGVNRYATAAAVVAAGEGSSASNVGLLASGTSTIDALAGGPVAYKGKHPLFLTTRDDIPGVIVQSMKAAGVTSVYVLGGEAVVSSAVLAELAANGISVAGRLAGADRSATSVAIARAVLSGSFNFSADTFNVASGLNNGVDALGGAALSGKQGRVLLITNNATSAAPITAFAEENRARLTAVGTIFGGTAVVAPSLETAIETEGGTGSSNQTFTVTPNSPAVLNVVRADSPNVASDDRQFSVTTPAGTSVHQIQLVPAANVTVSASGAVTFMDVDGTNGAGDDMADFGDVAARLVSINNQAFTGTDTDRGTAVPVANTITFTIDGEDVESVVPVVFFDADTDGMLDLDANNLPVAAEQFGVGGATSFLNPAASTGATAGAVTSVDKAANSFNANNLVFTFDANDTFRIGGVPASQEEFEAALSTGDSVAANYSATAAASSEFNLDNASPSTAPNPTATVANSNDVTLTVDLGTAPVADSVVIQRAAVTGSSVGTFATIATEPATDDVTGTNGVQVRYVDNDVPAGSYQYRAILVKDGDEGAPSATPVGVTTTNPTAADTTAPTVVDARVGTNGGSAFLLEAGDTFLLALSEVAAAPSAGDTIRVSDTDGTLVDIVAAGGNFSLNSGELTINGTTYAAGRVLTVTRGTDVLVVAGSQTGLGLPATVTQQSGTTDAAGNQLNIAGSADVVIDTEEGTVSTPNAAPTLDSAVAAGNGTGADTATLTFSETVLPQGGTYADAQFFYDADCNGGIDSVRGTITQPTAGNTLTLTLADGTLPTTDDTNDCIGYVDDNTSAVDAGDVVDAGGAAVVSPDSATVPAATA